MVIIFFYESCNVEAYLLLLNQSIAFLVALHVKERVESVGLVC